MQKKQDSAVKELQCFLSNKIPLSRSSRLFLRSLREACRAGRLHWGKKLRSYVHGAYAVLLEGQNSFCVLCPPRRADPMKLTGCCSSLARSTLQRLLSRDHQRLDWTDNTAFFCTKD